MKIFTAKEFHNAPAEVYRFADREGVVKINHDRYPDRMFILQAKERHTDIDNKNLIEVEDE